MRTAITPPQTDITTIVKVDNLFEGFEAVVGRAAFGVLVSKTKK